MTRTLADMTPAEQQACVGMWADFQPASTPRPVVILHAEDAWGRAVVFDPTAQVFEPIDATSGWVTPRFDLPRAWTPDGEPVPGEWAEGHMWWGEDTDTMEIVDVVEAECLATGAMSGFDEWPEGITPGEDVPVRRFITDWEEA